MANLEFTEDQVKRRSNLVSKKTLPEKMINWGIAKSVRQANIILIVLVCILLLITTYNLFSLTSNAPVPVEDPGRLIE